MGMDSCFSKCVIQAFHVVTDVDFQPILIRLLQVDVDFNTIDEDSLRHYNFDTTHKLNCHHQPLSSVWPVQPPISHLHVYVQSSVGPWDLHSTFGRRIIILSFFLATPLQLAERFYQVGERLHRVMWGRDLEDMLLDVPDCGGLRYIPGTQVNKLGLQDLGYNEKVLLVRHEYISAFDQLTSMSLNDRSGGVIVTGQPGIGANSLLFTITSLTSTLNSTKANPAFFFIFSSAVYVNASLLL